MKKTQFILTLLALGLACAGVFASATIQPMPDPRIDINGDGVCDLQVIEECAAFYGRPCIYDDNGTARFVYDKNANCTIMFRYE